MTQENFHNGGIMRNPLSLAAIFAMLAISSGLAQTNNNVTITANKTAVTNGKQMFTSYCAPCHGVDGKGHGPVATQLKTPPSDLTLLSKNNNGLFPEKHIAGILQFGSDLPSHGSPAMPVWGPILGKMDQSKPQVRQLRISNLSQYLKAIQVK
jgi:mono/diheme cytochrome c family protein